MEAGSTNSPVDDDHFFDAHSADALCPRTAHNLGTTPACHPDLLVMVVNLVVDLGHVVESCAILVVWTTLAMLAFAQRQWPEMTREQLHGVR